MESYDNADEKWAVILGTTDAYSYDKLYQTFYGKYVLFGANYQGYSNVLNLPAVIYEYAYTYSSGSYVFYDFVL